MKADEKHWLTETRPASLFYATERLPDRRKVRTARRLRLYACGCYRLVWDRIKLESIREAIVKTEEYADGEITHKELTRYRYPQGEPRTGSADDYLRLSIGSLITPKVIPAHIAWLVRAALTPSRYEQVHKWEECPEQADLVRDVFGNPFRPVAFDPAWRTSTAVAIARGMYEPRDFSAMPILADALQDAGCENADILDHCRGPGPHVRGCWVVDLVLGRG
jgi:hypothetical protein